MAAPKAMYVVGVKMMADDADLRARLAALNALAGNNTRNAAKAAVDHVKAFRESFQQFGAAVGSFRSQLSGLLSIYRGAVSIFGMGFKDVVKNSIGVNSEFEQMELKLALMTAKTDEIAGKSTTWAESLAKAKPLFADVMDKAASTGQSTEQVAGAFSLLLPFLTKAGASAKEVLDISSAASFWDILGRAGDTARDLKQIAQGNISMRVIQNPFLAEHLEEFKALRDEMSKALAVGDDAGALSARKKTLELMRKSLALSKEMEASIGGTFEGRMHKLTNSVKIAFVDGTAPFFDELKTWLSSATAWAKSPDGAGTIREYARGFARFVKGAAETLYKVFSFFFDNFKTIAAAFATFSGIWLLKNVIAFIGALNAFSVAMTAGGLKAFGAALLGQRTGAALGGAAAGAAGAAGSGAAGAGAGAGGAAAVAKWGAPALGTLVAQVAAVLGVSYLLYELTDQDVKAAMDASWAARWKAIDNDKNLSDVEKALYKGTEGLNVGQFVVDAFITAPQLEKKRQSQGTADLAALDMIKTLTQGIRATQKAGGDPSAMENHILGFAQGPNFKQRDEGGKIVIEFRGADIAVISKEGAGKVSVQQGKSTLGTDVE